MERLQINDVMEIVNDNYQKVKKSKKKIERKKHLENIGFNILIYSMLVCLIGSGCSISLKKKRENMITNNKIATFTIQNDTNLENLKLGTLFEEYYGEDLEDDKVRLLDESIYLAYVKLALDLYKEGTIDKERFNAVIDSKISQRALRQANEVLEDYITIDNEDIDSIDFHYVKDASISSCRDIYYVKDEVITECIKNLDYLNNRNNSLTSNIDKLDGVIDGILKATVYDIELEEHLFLPDKVEMRKESSPKQKKKTYQVSEGIKHL